jgi:hypothetical protein
LCIFDIRVGAMGDEQMDDIEVVITSYPLHRSSDEVSAKCFNLCSLLEDIATCGDLRINGCPMRWSDVLLIAICSPRTPGLYELSDDVEVSTLGRHENNRLFLTILSD